MESQARAVVNGRARPCRHRCVPFGKPLFRVAIGALLVGCGSHSGASEISIGGEEAFLADIPIVMSATRLPQPLLESPVSTTIITREMIEDSGFNQLADVFRLVPGFQVAHATGGHFVVAYHGQEFTLASRLEVLIDGRSVYGNILSSVQWNTLGIALEDIERIEVIRGPNAPVFGANAMVATINIITRQPYAESGTWIDTTVGSIGTRDLLLRHAASAGALDYRVSLGWKQNDGFDVPPEKGPDFDDTRLGSITFRGAWSPSSSDDVDIQFGLTSGESATLEPKPNVLLHNHDGDAKSHYQFIRWTRSRAVDDEFYLQFYHNYNDQRDRSDFGPISAFLGISPALVPFVIGGRPDQSIRAYYGDGTSERYDLELQRRMRIARALRMVWGTGLRLDRLRSNAHLNREGFVDNPSARLFGNAEWSLSDDLSLHLGAMLEHNDVVGPFGSARLAANYRVAHDQAVRASISATQRSPSIIEQEWDFLLRFNDGTPLNQIFYSPGDLEPERLEAVELGYAYIPLDGHLQFDAKLFRERATDIISNYRDLDFPDPYLQDGVEVNINDDSYRVSGLEGVVRWRPERHDLLSFQYSVTKSHRDLYRGGDDEPLRIEHNATPRRTYSLLYTHDFPADVSASLGYYYRSGIKWVGDGDTVDSYERVDLRIGKRISGKRLEGNIDLIVQNIGDDYQEYISAEEKRAIFETRYFIRAGLHFL